MYSLVDWKPLHREKPAMGTTITTLCQAQQQQKLLLNDNL